MKRNKKTYTARNGYADTQQQRLPTMFNCQHCSKELIYQEDISQGTCQACKREHNETYTVDQT